MATVQIIIQCVTVCVLFATLACFDVVAKRLHDRFPETWEELGRPSGFFWVPRGTSWLRGWDARQRLIFKVAFSRPDWLVQDCQAKSARRWFVAGYVCCCVLVLIGMVTMVMTPPP